MIVLSHTLNIKNKKPKNVFFVIICKKTMAETCFQHAEVQQPQLLWKENFCKS